MKNVSWKRVAVLFFGFWVLGHLVAGCAGTLPTTCTTDSDCARVFGSEY